MYLTVNVFVLLHSECSYGSTLRTMQSSEGSLRQRVRWEELGRMKGWSPAPVVYGKVNRTLSQSLSPLPEGCCWAPGHSGMAPWWVGESRGGQGTGGGHLGVHCAWLPMSDKPSLGHSGTANHLAADWDCAAIIIWETALSARCCWPMPARTDIAMASAAALELRPLWPPEGLGASELCWMTGAGEPVGSEVSFMLSSAATMSKNIITLYYIQWIANKHRDRVVEQTELHKLHIWLK